MQPRGRRHRIRARRPDSTTVIFEFRQAGTLFDVQTRTASDDQKTVGWTESGPRFSKVDLYLGRNGSKILSAAVPRKV